jgi:hypothetical protein
MKQPSFRHWLGPFAVLVLAACSSATDERSPLTSTTEDYCQRACVKAHACKDTTDATECSSACRSSLAAQPPLRSDLLAYVATCIENSTCASGSTVKCTSEARAQLAASDIGKKFCTALLAAGTTCDASGASYPESSCLIAAKSYEDEALKVAHACLTESCSTLSACLARAIPDVMLLP